MAPTSGARGHAHQRLRPEGAYPRPGWLANPLRRRWTTVSSRPRRDRWQAQWHHGPQSDPQGSGAIDRPTTPAASRISAVRPWLASNSARNVRDSRRVLRPIAGMTRWVLRSTQVGTAPTRRTSQSPPGNPGEGDQGEEAVELVGLHLVGQVVAQTPQHPGPLDLLGRLDDVGMVAHDQVDVV